MELFIANNNVIADLSGRGEHSAQKEKFKCFPRWKGWSVFMEFRTDLALELREDLQELPRGVSSEEENRGKAKITRIKISTTAGAKAFRKPVGTYVTVELPPFSDYVDDENQFAPLIAEELRPFLPQEGAVIVAGLGNDEITPDAIGPLTAGKILVTRHLRGEFARVCGIDSLRSVATVIPGVLGQTGIDAAELLKCVVQSLRPACLIAVDAFAARSLSRLGNTVQISDAGLSPGSGVSNARPQLSCETMGIPVISVGVPTVVDGATLAACLSAAEEDEQFEELRRLLEPRGAKMMVTPREIDLLVQRAAKMVALAVNCALQKDLSVEEILMLQS